MNQHNLQPMFQDRAIVWEQRVQELISQAVFDFPDFPAAIRSVQVGRFLALKDESIEMPGLPGSSWRIFVLPSEGMEVCQERKVLFPIHIYWAQGFSKATRMSGSR